MYASSNAMQCELCGKRDKSVAKRLVVCADVCRCEDETIACKSCADASYEREDDE